MKIITDPTVKLEANERRAPWTCVMGHYRAGPALVATNGELCCSQQCLNAYEQALFTKTEDFAQ